MDEPAFDQDEAVILIDGPGNFNGSAFHLSANNG